jgi:glucose/arabinose dehydrogenase
MKFDRNYRITDTQLVNVGHRIRDLEVGINGDLIATTDEGRLLEISLK